MYWKKHIFGLATILSNYNSTVRAGKFKLSDRWQELFQPQGKIYYLQFKLNFSSHIHAEKLKLEKKIPAWWNKLRWYSAEFYWLAENVSQKRLLTKYFMLFQVRGYALEKLEKLLFVEKSSDWSKYRHQKLNPLLRKKYVGILIRICLEKKSNYHWDF